MTYFKGQWKKCSTLLQFVQVAIIVREDVFQEYPTNTKSTDYKEPLFWPFYHQKQQYPSITEENVHR